MLAKLNVNTNKLPLSFYKDHSFYTMRTDARDRFGTPLEQRFSKNFINDVLLRNNFTDINFSNFQPFYHVIATKK